MLRRVILALVVAVVVTLACILLGMLLGVIDLAVTSAIGGFLEQWATVIGILAGLWYFFRGSLSAA